MKIAPVEKQKQKNVANKLKNDQVKASRKSRMKPGDTCHACGETRHWAPDCPNKEAKLKWEAGRERVFVCRLTVVDYVFFFLARQTCAPSLK